MTQHPQENDAALLAAVEQVRSGRDKAGLLGLTAGLEAVVIATEPDRFRDGVRELLETTGHALSEAFTTREGDFAVLSLEGSADLVVRTRAGSGNPFREANKGVKTGDVPGTRLETFIFRCEDVERYVGLQQARGTAFLEEDPFGNAGRRFAQTAPSPFTGNSVGLLERRDASRSYAPADARPLDLALAKNEAPHLARIGRLDHVATRVRAEERDAAILEFMGLTSYDFAFAVYVEFLNSITNVARLAPGEYAQVFTSGIAPFTTPETSGPTELFIHNYGPRSHHMAFDTRDIEDVVEALKAQGVGFLSELVGSREEGLKQIFTKMSRNTLLVNEYIHRYDGFDGFFTKSNVTLLTQSTLNQ
ncbi:hypothetical protein NNJEOMEG_02989 [Fundidesulfovibrio magnetotacticus]|uniref:VOC domain-containing protein n=1 Tax=Fundidesulfovibrio magnetotacticus TaxID=2730080 RepID=A0A6V8LX21_9BACT|nr:hypothetical protein [Fundidesulfovibrio magnetotacticus]GFK95131.1 hypothetical protein NNJEOMEG_02989 [Fundidesulfovibrio magnetotacticus]